MIDPSRMANTVAILRRQGYVHGIDGLWRGKHYDAEIEDGYLPMPNGESEAYFIRYTANEATRKEWAA